MSQKEIQVPKGWELKKISEICDVNPSKFEIKDLPDSTLVSFIPMKNVDDKQGIIKTKDEKSLGSVRKGYTYFKNNDVIFAKITPCMENGKIAIGSDLQNGIGFASTEFHVLRPHYDVLPEWIHYFLRNESFRKEAKENFTGSAGQQRVPKGFLETHIIPVPKIEIQKKIIIKLEKILSGIDNQKQQIIFSYQIQLSNLFSKKRNFSISTDGSILINKLTKRIISAGFEGKLIPDMNSFDFEKYDAEIKSFNDNKKKYTGRSYHENVVNKFHSSLSIPKKWSWVRLDSISELISGQHILSRDYNSTGVGIPYLTGPADFGNISPKITKWTEKPKTMSQKNDVLITVKGNGVGKVNLLNIDSACISRQLMAIRTDCMIPLLLYYFLNSQLPNLSKLAGDWTTVPGIGRESILQLEIPLIPKELQESTLVAIKEKLLITNNIESKLKTIFSNYQKSINSLKKFNHSVFDMAFSGKLVN